MQHSESIRYLENAGIHYKPAESPDLWSYLEGHFAPHAAIGPKFAPMPADFVAKLIAMGEDALLEAFVTHHKQSGTVAKVERVIDLPCAVGVEALVPLAATDRHRVLRLIRYPGTQQEHVINVLPAEPDAIPSTSRVTITGGLYADGHTAGFFDLYPGEHTDTEDAGYAYLATKSEITALVHEMEAKLEDIGVAMRPECEQMIEKARLAIEVRKR